MIRLALCDDNEEFAKRLAGKVAAYGKKVGVDFHTIRFETPRQLAASQDAFDIVLLDINMPDIDGITLARSIRRGQPDTFIVFVTSYMEYALQGYEVAAFRYILKSQLDDALPHCLDDILAALLAKRKSYRFRFVEGETAVRAEDILYIESERHKLLFHLRGSTATLTLYARLDEVESTLNDMRFLRIHKSFLVNLKHVVRVKNYEATLDDGTLLPIPKQKYAAVKQKFVLLKGEL